MPIDNGVNNGNTGFCNEMADGESGGCAFIGTKPVNSGGIGLPIGMEGEREALQAAVKWFGRDARTPAALQATQARVAGIDM